MNLPFPISLYQVIIDCKNPLHLADFYEKLLGWNKKSQYPKNNNDPLFVVLKHPTEKVLIGFQKNELYSPPIWPEEIDKQQQMEHLDFIINNKEQLHLAVEHAIACGARKSPTQFNDNWTVMVDPEGHPFCFVLQW